MLSSTTLHIKLQIIQCQVKGCLVNSHTKENLCACVQVPALPDGKINAIRAVGCNSLHFNWNVNSLVCSRSCQWCVWLHGSICWNRTWLPSKSGPRISKKLFLEAFLNEVPFLFLFCCHPPQCHKRNPLFSPPVWITHAVTERGTLAVKRFWTVRF